MAIPRKELLGTLSVNNTTDPLGGVIIAEFTAHDGVNTWGTQVVPPFSGWIVAIATIPGNPAPSEGFTVRLTDEDGIDRLGGIGRGMRPDAPSRYELSANTLHRVLPLEPLTLSITENTTPGAVLKVKIYYLNEAPPAGNAF